MAEQFTAAIIGAGTMGSGIAQKIAQEGIPVYLVDVTQEQVENGLETIKEMLEQGIDRGIFTEEFVQETIDNITLTTDYEDLADVDFIVEAVFEDFDVKTEVLQELDRVTKPETILSSNTSSFKIKDLAEQINRPDRFLGMHYFFHPAKNRLLEIVKHEGTSEETLEIAQKFADLHNKTSIHVKDRPGFAVNRFFVPWLVESTRIYENGYANMATIDTAARETFKIGMGPFELMNASGIPIAYHSAVTFSEEIAEFYTPTKLLKDQVDSGELWEAKDGEVDESKFEKISEHLLATIFGAAGALVDEGVATIEAINRGAIVGLRWNMGPFQLANEYGVEYAYDIVTNLVEEREGEGFYVPEVLRKQAEKGEPFTFSYIDTEIEDGIATITINRPEAMNALNPEVVDELTEKYNAIESDNSVKAIVFKGAGKAFVAGADIKFFVDSIENDNIDANVEFTSEGHELFRRIETSDKLTIAVLDGLSLGGGSELALSAQAIVATDEGSLGFPESGLGIYPGLGGMIRTERHLGKELAKYFALTGKTISAQEAYDLGIVNKYVNQVDIDDAIAELVEEGQFDKYAERELPEKYQEIQTAFSDNNIEKVLAGESIDGVDENFVQKTAKTLSYKSPNSVDKIQKLIDKESEVSIDEAIDIELSYLEPMFETEEALVGLNASLAGERPDFDKVTS